MVSCIERRTVLQTAGIAGLALLLPRLARAEDPVPPPPPEPQIVVTGEIGSNHGHEVRLTPVQVAQFIRETAASELAVVLDIQGVSGHPHGLELTHAELLALLVTGVLEKSSTLVAGHAHSVVLRLDLI